MSKKIPNLAFKKLVFTQTLAQKVTKNCLGFKKNQNQPQKIFYGPNFAKKVTNGRTDTFSKQ